MISSKKLCQNLIQDIKKRNWDSTIDKLQFTAQLSKIQLGKIMKCVLRKITDNNLDILRDVSTPAGTQIINDLIANQQNTENN
ncbi:acetyl-CoA synthetase [Bartonella sp. JB63]|nr:acetyl-CoA synthetase [Bartonella sp. JB15]AQX29769.1 acetyl-CoA synthetase [Bartonella sp. JB63]